jgi:hypothetical protein
MEHIHEDGKDSGKKKKSSSKADIVKRMMNAYKRRKRDAKIAKLNSRDDLWKGLN